MPSDPEFAQMEKETFEKVSVTLSAIDRAVSAWNASRIKPQDMGERIERLRRFQSSLNSWIKEFSRVKSASKERRLENLGKFIEICYSYEYS